MQYLVFDLEAETYESNKRKANPFDDRNYVVARGWKKRGDAACSYEYYGSKEQSVKSYLHIPDNIDLLVGFNIKYDLHWEMVIGNPELTAFYKRGGKIWDCQYVEYLLHAQHENYHYPALNDVAPRYGGTNKIDEIKILWESGVKTSEIPEDLLIDYLVGTEEEHRDGGDIGNTEKTFLGQIKAVKAHGMLKMVMDRMDGLAGTTEMEFNGLKIDVVTAEKQRVELEADYEKTVAELESYIPDLPEGMVFNWNSPYHKSALVFGGVVKYKHSTTYLDEETEELARLKASAPFPLFNKKTVDPRLFKYEWMEINGEFRWARRKKFADTVHKDFQLSINNGVFLLRKGQKCFQQDMFVSGKRKGEYKTKKMPIPGALKTKYQDFTFDLPGYTEPSAAWKSKSLTDGNDNPIWSLDTKVMDILENREIPFLKALTGRAKLVKELGTYYRRYDEKKKTEVGMLTCLGDDNVIHHQLNHVNTVTTRLSSSSPNLQNLPRGDKSKVKNIFVSRGKDGIMIEADYSQLEVVVLGVLSEDAQLCKDLNDRIDFHCKRVSAKYGCTYEEALEWCKDEAFAEHAEWKKRRTKAKIFSFQRAYGAGATTIALETSLPVDDIKDMIAKEEKMYPGVVRFNAQVEEEVNATATPFNGLDEDGNWKEFARGYWQAPTGTRYTWRTRTAPAFMRKQGISHSFSPPELKNYPVQGTGGEFVQAMIGQLWRRFVETDNYGGRALLVNTVHDCIWVDLLDPSILDEVCADIKRIMENIPKFYNSRHGMNITVPFPVDVEYGSNMYSMHHWIESNA